MKLFLSPAKRLDTSANPNWPKATTPEFRAKATQIMQTLRELNVSNLEHLMDISNDLAVENYERYISWSSRPVKNYLYAAHMFDGEVYRGLKEEELKAKDWSYLQKNLFILSGLYGVLRPLDKVRPYRLEMGTHLSVAESENLYDFWGEFLTDFVNKKTKKGEVLLNLSSQEYMKVLQKDRLKGQIVDLKFLDMHQGKLKQITVFFKKARGSMVNFCARTQAQNLDDVKAFSEMGYAFDEKLSHAELLVFTR